MIVDTIEVLRGYIPRLRMSQYYYVRPLEDNEGEVVAFTGKYHELNRTRGLLKRYYGRRLRSMLPAPYTTLYMRVGEPDQPRILRKDIE